MFISIFQITGRLSFEFSFENQWRCVLSAENKQPSIFVCLAVLLYLFLRCQISKISLNTKTFHILGNEDQGMRMCHYSQGSTPLSDPLGGSSEGKLNPSFFSVANTSNGSKIDPQAPNGSK